MTLHRLEEEEQQQEHMQITKNFKIDYLINIPKLCRKHIKNI